MSQLPFADKPLLLNPFGRLVGDPFAENVDVAEINERAFSACRLLVEQVGAQGASGAITLFGEAGAGKTHLLGRLRRFLHQVPRSLFVPVRMDTSAKMLWRHLRRNFADALLRTSGGSTRAIDELLRPRQHDLEYVEERDLGIVLESLLKGMHVRDASAWLRGQDLPEEVLTRLTLALPGPDENQELNSRNIVVALCKLLEPGQVVFCFDQWEALQIQAGDTEGLHAAGQAVSFLHDAVKNSCVICCLQTSFLLTLEKIIDVATLQRMAGRREAIDLLDWTKASHLVSALLDSSPPIAELRKGKEDPLWPLQEKAIQAVFEQGQAPARKVISRCKDLFDLWLSGRIQPVVPLDVALREMFEERVSPVATQDSGPALQNGLPVLFEALGIPMEPQVKGSPFDFTFPTHSLKIMLDNRPPSKWLVERLKKVRQVWDPSADKLLLLRDARLPISLGSTVTRKELDGIELSGGRVLPVSPEAVAALAALRRLLADAQSGDLALRGDAIPTATVKQWIAGHLPESLDTLVAEMGAPDKLRSKLAELLASRKIVSIAEASQELNSRPEEVEACARRDPRLFGMLGGSMVALFQPVYKDSKIVD